MSNSSEYTEEDEIIPSSSVQFWTFLIFQIPSLACTLFLLYHFARSRTLREAIHNHLIIILLILVLAIEILDNPLYIDGFRLGGHAYSFPMTPSICLMWWILDYGFYGAITVFLAWGSIERHLLVFHHHLFRTRRQKIVVHYLPLLGLSIYLSVFYFIVIVYPPCENTFDSTALICGASLCYEEVPWLNIWDYLGNGVICTCIEAMSSTALLIRVILHRRRIHRGIRWKKHRKMAFQLLSISALNLSIVFPQSLIVLIQNIGSPQLVAFVNVLDPYFFYLTTFVVFLLPVICLIGLPELWRRQQTVVTIAQLVPTGRSLPQR